MKRSLLALFVVLALMVSCATKPANAEQPGTAPEQEVIKAEVVSEEPAAQEQAVVEPVSEQVTVEENAPEQTSQEAEPAQAEAEQTEVAEVENSVDEKPSEDEVTPSIDGDYTFTEQAPEQVEEPVEEKPEEQLAPVAEQTAPAAEEPKQTESQPAAAKSNSLSAPVSEEKPVPAPLSVVQKIGNFIVGQKLLSIGLLTCLIGVVYVIVALFKSSSRRGGKHHDDPSGTEVEETYENPESDSQSESENEDVPVVDEDDEFLRNLLSEDR